MTVSNLKKMVESSHDRVEKAVEIGDVTPYEQFSFSHIVFRRLALQTSKNKDLL